MVGTSTATLPDVPAARSGYWWLPLAVLVPAIVAYPWLGPTAQSYVYIGMSATAVAAVVVGYLLYHPRDASPWILTGCAFAMYLAADVYYNGYDTGPTGDVPFPSWADLGYLVFYPFLFAAFARVLWHQRQPDRAAWLDALVWTTGASVFLWEGLVEPGLDGSGMGPFAASVATAYPVMDALVLLMVLRIVSGHARPSISMVLLITAMSTQFLADVVYLGQLATGSYVDGGMLDLGWLVTYLLVAGAALHPSMVQLTEPSDSAFQLASRWRLLVLVVPALIAPTWVAYQVWTGAVTGEVDDTVVCLVASVLVLVFIVARGSGLLTVAYRRTGQLDEQQAALQASLVARDEVTEQLWQRVNRDELTGLKSRSRFVERVGQALSASASSGTSVSVAVLDLDDFKTVNDSLGHDAGDLLLRAVAARLTEVVPDGDLIARFSGDDFAVLIHGDVGEVVERVLTALSEPVLVSGRQLRPAASIGVVTTTGARLTPGQILQAADVAMYEAKRSDTRWCQYRPGMTDQMLQRLDLRERLVVAIRDGEITPWFQPIVSLRTGKLLGFEVLARWCAPGAPPVPPAGWLALAEESGLIADIDRSVLRSAVAQFRRWQREFPIDGLHLAVNLSGKTLQQADIADDVISVLAEQELPCPLLTLEVTEGVVLDDPDVTTRLQQLRAAGIRIALDDFGTGWSSLDYLRRFPVDQLKLDRSFTSDIADGTGGRAIPAAVIQLATTLGMDVVAEGVETQEHRTCLIELGFDASQGYLFSAALPAIEVRELLKRVNRPLGPRGVVRAGTAG